MKLIKSKKGVDNFGISIFLFLIIFISFLGITKFLIESDSLSFQNMNHKPNLLTGYSTSTSGRVGFVILSRCNIKLYEGWNFISICSNITNTSIDDVFSDIDGDYRYILEWNESSQEFLLYSPRAQTNPFDHVKKNQSYFIYYEPSNTTNLNFVSTQDYENITITMPKGWNAIFYPYIFTSNFSIYLDTMNNTYRYFMLWNKSSQEFSLFSPRESQHIIQYIDKGEGQFIYCDNETCTLHYIKSDLN